MFPDGMADSITQAVIVVCPKCQTETATGVIGGIVLARLSDVAYTDPDQREHRWAKPPITEFFLAGRGREISGLGGDAPLEVECRHGRRAVDRTALLAEYGQFKNKRERRMLLSDPPSSLL
jgi:hypothetical protein